MIEEIMSWAERYGSMPADRVLLGANEIPKELRPKVASVLACQNKLRQKLPHLKDLPIYVPNSLNLEQASSLETAQHKRSLLRREDVLLEMTGGLGIDFSEMARAVHRAVYVEQDAQLFQASEHNFKHIFDEGVSYAMVQGNAMDLLGDLLKTYQPTVIYLDPARRVEQTKTAERTYAIEDCSPNLFELIRQLEQTEHCPARRILVKLSPMLDIKYCLREVPKLKSLHIVALHNEVKELILEIDLSLPNDFNNFQATKLMATDLFRHRSTENFEMANYNKEEDLPSAISSELGQYLYEPSKALMKLGVFRSIASAYALCSLGQHSHLYTSDEFLEEFQGKRFKVEELIPFSSTVLKKLGKRLGQANVICRNFPLKANVLEKKLRIKSGGDTYLLATSLADTEQVLIIAFLIN